jgi:hypothetical protein
MLRLRKLLILSLAVMPAYCSTIAFTDLPSWTAASSGFTNINFEGYAGESSGITINGVTFTGPYNTGAAMDILNGTSGLDWGTLTYVRGPNQNWGNGRIHVTLPSGITAVAVDLMMMTTSPNNQALAGMLTINVSTDGTTYDTYTAETFLPTHLGFLGVTSTSSIQWIDFVSASGPNRAIIDNFRFGSANDPTPPADTPEPLTALLFGSGLVLLVSGRYARKRFALGS